MMTNFEVLNKYLDFSVAYTWFQLMGALLVLKPGAAYTRVYTVYTILGGWVEPWNKYLNLLSYSTH